MKNELSRDHFSRLLRRSSRILDLGCGSGIDALHFAADGHSVTAIDLRPDKIARLKYMLGDAAICADFSEMDLGVHTFDGVWAAESLCYLRPKLLPDVIGAVANCLQCPGTLFLSFPYAEVSSSEPRGSLFAQTTRSMKRLLGSVGLSEISTNVCWSLRTPSRSRWISSIYQKLP